ncbi:hypothetical protein MMC25_002031 [Agyrium rufum]|nr:hypothetical protein [Agyrium rufum]
MRSSIVTLTALAASVSAQKCPIVFDGRLPKTSCVTSFDLPSSPFLDDFVYGQNQTFGEIIKLPGIASEFDYPKKAQAYEVTIDDGSIFAPNPTSLQTGFRRSELIPNTTDASTSGIKTLHFSLQADPHRPLNYSHEYQLVFLETATFSTNQFALKTGEVAEVIAANPRADPRFLYFQGNVEGPVIKTLFKTPFVVGVWHNFGVVLDFTRNKTTILYSFSDLPLVPVTLPISNDLSGNGQYHFGILKKPTGNNLTDVTTQGFQEKGINEGIIYGGIFEEDSAKGCISFAPGLSLKRDAEERDLEGRAAKCKNGF